MKIKAKAEISRMKSIEEKDIESSGKKINEHIKSEIDALIKEEVNEAK